MSGAGRVMRTVWSSTFSIAPGAGPKVSRVCSSCTTVPSSLVTSPTKVSSPVLTTIAAMRVAIELFGTWLSHQRFRLKITSSAMKSSPLVHFTPCRSFSV